MSADATASPDKLQEPIQLPYGNGQTWQEIERQHREEIERAVAAAITRERLNTNTPAGWTPATEPPDGTKGMWSRKVAVFTMAGDCHALAYFHDDRSPGGRWQNPKAMPPGDKPLYWTELPKQSPPTP